jgi:hypothetical protein
MTFKLQPPESFSAPVEIVNPGGTIETLNVEFKWLSRDEFADYCKAGKDLDDDKFFAGLINGWDADEACNAAGMKKLFGYRPRAPRALFEKYRSELLEVEEKN